MARKTTATKAAAGPIAGAKKGTSPAAGIREGNDFLAEPGMIPGETSRIEPGAGEFRGDFTRDTFDPPRHYSRVLMQQGRVQLDADWNEQADIVLHYLRALAQDVFGPYGGPQGDGFRISAGDSTLTIGKGRYYVDGILCENDGECAYTLQPDYPLSEGETKQWKDLLEKKVPCLVYLDVWERHITLIQDRKIREIALNGPDTATRAQVVWQVRILQSEALQKIIDKSASPKDRCGTICGYIRDKWSGFDLRGGRVPQLKVKAMEAADSTDACIIRPDARYRGPENQLYRVEIHHPGSACSGNDEDCATFKWSRDNSSIDFPIVSIEGSSASLAHLGRDDQSTLTEGDWVEVLGDIQVLRQEPGSLVRVESVDRAHLSVTFSSDVPSLAPQFHPLVRRWDQREGSPKGRTLRDGAIPVTEGTTETDWIELEDGVQIQFQPSSQNRPIVYLPGDYWLIPARVVSGDVGWPWDGTGEQPRPPHGIAHHYAPLAVAYFSEKWIPCDCRCLQKPVCTQQAQKG
jgi:hypothetical protein